MNIEDLIRNNKERFEGGLSGNHQDRFVMKLQAQMKRKNNIRRFWLGVSSAAAVVLIVLMLQNQDMMKPQLYQENSKVAEMRNVYEQQVDEAIMLLEDVLENVDDSTKMEINKVIENLTSTAEIFAEIAPLPEEKQLAITSQVYNNQLQSINIIYRKIKNEEK